MPVRYITLPEAIRVHAIRAAPTTRNLSADRIMCNAAPVRVSHPVCAAAIGYR